MNTPIVPFKIRFTREVIFRTNGGQVLRTFRVGDVIDATHDTGIYYVTPMGGIYHDEAERV